MNGMKQMAAVAVAGLLAFGTGIAFGAETKAPEAAKPAEASKTMESSTPAKMSKEVKGDRIVRGELTAVDSATMPPTVTLKVAKGKQGETMTVAVPASAKILEGKAVKSVADLKAGDTVRIKYDQLQNGLQADQIHILKVAKTKAS
jgi:CxxC motif-containing protein